MMEDTNGFATGYAVGRDTNGNCGYGNNGMFGNDWFWVVILMLFGYGGFGFGGRGFGGFGGGFGGGCGSPCATQADLAAGFNNSAVLSGINGIDSALCQGFNGINTAILQNGYNTQGAINGLSHQISDCCCGTKQAIADVKYTVAQEACETRHAMSNNTRDIIDNANANSRAILDFLTNDKIATLTAENQSLKFAASQSAQNAYIGATVDSATAELIRRLGRDCPVPAYVVPNPNCCYNSNVTFGNGCGSF